MAQLRLDQNKPPHQNKLIKASNIRGVLFYSLFNNRFKQSLFWCGGKNGYIALISVIILGAIGLAVATSLLLLGLGSSKASFAIEQSKKANAAANACAELALKQIKTIPGFTGSGNATMADSTQCSYTVLSALPPKTIYVSGTAANIIRKTKITVSASSPVTISSWQEVADF